MKENFDAYHKWLGIPPSEQPPNYYRLLGLTVLESDVDAIQSAAEQRIAYVRSLAVSDLAAVTQRILNELTAAKLCLLNPEEKTAYDRQFTVQQGLAARAQPGEPRPKPPSRLSPAPAGRLSRNLILASVAVVSLLFLFMLATHWVGVAFRERDEDRQEVAVENSPALIGQVQFPDAQPEPAPKTESSAVGKSKPAVVPVVLAEKAAQKPATASSNPPPSSAIAPFDAQQAKQHQQEWAKHLHRPVIETNSIGMKLTLIPPGEFTMGQTDGNPSERPAHRVRITRAFYLGIHEITQAEYQAVTGNSPSREFKGDDLPVEQVSALDAEEFCRLLTERERRAGSLPLGASYRLPTEAEREYAARAGTTTKWCCGDDAQHLGEYAWYDANSGKRMHPVGQKQPNAFGLYDMYGNVWEWCSDWYDENYYATSPGDDPQGPAAGSLRVFRGGGWINEPVFSRSAVRNHNSPSHREVLVGFRVVLAMVEAESQIVATVTPAQKPTAAPSNSPPSPAIAPFNAQQAKHHQEQWAKHLHRSVIETNSIGMKLALIPPGEFLMGSPADEEGRRNDERRRKVTITNPFFICTHEVSVAEFRRFVEATGFKTEAEVDGKGGEGREQKGGRNEWLAKPQYSWRNQGTFILSDSHPVTNVTANDASAFCDWLSRSEGRKYRLPTEEEWEFACRGGTTTPWFWGARPEGAENYAWFSVNNAGVLHPVGLKMPNPFGLYDMAGNVVEMTTTEEPATLQTRGGHFCCEVSEIGSASRWLRPERSFRIYLSGFRIISEIRESDPPREESAHKASTPPLATAIGTDASRAAGEGREEGPLPPIIGVDWPGDIDCARSAMVIGIRPRFDIRKSWGLSLEFKASNFSKGWHMIFFWGDDRFARDPIHVRMDGPVLEAGFDDATNERTQVIRVKLSTANARRWKKLLLTYDAVSRELTLSLDEKVLGKQRCGFAPSVDRPMPVIIGEVHSRAEGKPDGQPFLGRVRNVRLENGVDAN